MWAGTMVLIVPALGVVLLEWMRADEREARRVDARLDVPSDPRVDATRKVPSMSAKDRCIRCGGPVAEGVGVCNRCNPARLPGPSSTQYHATVFLVVLVEHGADGGRSDPRG